MTEYERNSRALVIPTHKSLSPPARANPSASSASPKSPDLASFAGSVSRSKTLQVRASCDPGNGISSSASSRKACMCSPTNHPGSFRCRLHRKSNTCSSSANSQLNVRRSAMANSLVKIGSVEGDWVRRSVTALIRPSSHHTRRRTSFQPRPSRLRHMTTAQDVS